MYYSKTVLGYYQCNDQIISTHTAKQMNETCLKERAILKYIPEVNYPPIQAIYAGLFVAYSEKITYVLCFSYKRHSMSHMYI